MVRRFSSQFLGMNSTVVYHKDAAYVIDPGVFPTEIERIEKFLKENGFKSISILLTHTHGDHISGYYAFKRFPVYGHKSISFKSDDIRYNDLRYLRGMWRKQGITDLEQLEFPCNIYYATNGELIEILPYSFVFYHVPGHSIDMSVIVIPQEHLIFSGDMLVQIPAPFVLQSTIQYWESLKQIKDLVYEYHLECLIPGHGKPANSQDEIVQRIENEQKYLRQLIWEGIKLARAGIDGENLKKELYNLSDQYRNLHSHQVNVQTFYRELDDWLVDERIDLK